MSIKHFSRGVALFGMMGMTLVTAREVRAERVITDYEASRLTYSALIAPPVVRHRTIHKHVASHRGKAAQRVRIAHTARAVPVRNVTYRGRLVSSHRRNRHHRHG